MAATVYVTLDPNLIFSYGGTRLADSDPLEITAASGVEVTLQISAPMAFTASHDEKGKTINWKSVATTDGTFARAWAFPCPRSPFTLTVSTTSTTGAGTSKTKKVRIEAGASGTARGRDVSAGAGKPKPGQ